MNNGKKIIIMGGLSIVIILVVVCFHILPKQNDKAGKEVNINSDSTDMLADNETSKLQYIDETVAEAATTKLEIETIDPSVDPFTAEPVGTYKNRYYNGYVVIRLYENGAKRYAYHVESENKDYEFASMDEMPEVVSNDMFEKMVDDGIITTEVVDVLPGVIEESKDEYVENTTTEFVPKEPYVKPEVDELTWLRQKYGDTIQVGDGTYTYSEEWNTYVVKRLYGTVHVMTSETTSQEKKIYRIDKINIEKFAEAKGYSTGIEEKWLPLGCTSYENIDYYEDMQVVSYKEITDNNLKYMDSVIVSKSENVGRVEEWDYVTSHGMYIRLNKGYIVMWVINPGETKAVEKKFSIEEYYNLVNSKNYEVVEHSQVESFINGKFEVVYNYVVMK